MADEAELAFVATMRDEASAVARSARQTLDSIGGDTKPITTKLDVEASGAKAAIEDVSSIMDTLPRNAAGTVSETSAEFRQLAPEVKAAVLRAKADAAAAAAGIGDELAKPLEEVPPIAEREGEEAARGFSDKLLGGLKGIGGKIAGILGGAAVGGAFVSMLDTDAAVDKLAAGLGATPGIAQRYGKVASNLYAGAWGESMDEVTAAVGAVSSSIGGLGSGKELQSATAQALDYATVFEVDVVRAAATAGGAIRAGLAKDATEAFDLMTAASQKVPAQLREDVLDASDEYGQFFAALGYDGPAAFGALAAGAAKGMYGIDKTGDAIKEFTIRSTDMSTASKDAYSTIGLNAREMANEILAGGDRAKSATDKIIGGILGIEDPAKRANTAIALFGTPLEDIGVKDIPKFLAGLRDGEAGLGKVEGASKRAGQTLNDNARTNLVSFGRQAKTQLVNVLGGSVLPALSSVAGFLSTTFGPAVEIAGDAVKSTVGFLREHQAIAVTLAVVIGVLAAATAAHAAVLAVAAAGGLAAWIRGTRIVSGITKVWAAVQWAMNAALAANPIVLVVVAIVALVAVLVLAWKRSETFRNIVLGAWAAIKGGVASAVNAVRGWISAAWKWIQAVTGKTWNAIKSGVSKAWNAIRNAVSNAVDAVRKVIGKVFGAIAGIIKGYVKVYLAVVKAAWNAIRAAISTVVNVVKGVVSKGFSLIRTGISNALNAAKQIVSRAWDAIRGAFTKGVSTVVGKAKELGGKVKSAISGFVGDMRNVGADLIRGLVSGVGDMAGALLNKVSDVVNGAKNKAKSLLGIKSPSRVFAYYGKMSIAGLIKGLSGGEKDVDKTLDRVFGGIRKYLDKKIRNDKRARAESRRVIRSLRDEADAIRANASARDLLVAASKKIPEIVKGFREAISLTGIESVNDAPMTAGFMVQGLRDRIAALRQFGTDLAELRRRGLSADLIAEIAAQGVEGGGAYAAALATATPEQIAEINAARGEVESVANEIGKGLKDGLKAQIATVEEAGKALARALARAIKRELKIKSPSRVAAEDGRNVARGLADGIIDATRDAELAASLMANRVSNAAIPTLPELARLAADASRITPTVRSAEVITVRHEVVSPDGSVSDLTAEQIAEMIARDPRVASKIETALRRVRRRKDSNTLSPSR